MSMYIEFMATLEDMVDTSYRFWERGKRKSRDWIYTAFSVAILLFLVALLLDLFPIRDWRDVLIRMWPLFLFIFLVVAAAFNNWLFHATRFRNRLRGVVRKKIPDHRAVPRPDGDETRGILGQATGSRDAVRLGRDRGD
jgi:hypothetical protein